LPSPIIANFKIHPPKLLSQVLIIHKKAAPK